MKTVTLHLDGVQVAMARIATTEGIDPERLRDFLNDRIVAARELRRGSTEDDRRGYNRELALQEVRREFIGEALP